MELEGDIAQLVRNITEKLQTATEEDSNLLESMKTD